MKKELLEKLKKQIRNGDRDLVAERVNCSVRTLDEALNGRSGRKSDAALQAFIEILEERKVEAKQLENRAENLF